PDESALVDPRGVFPSALALVLPPGPDAEPDAADDEVTYPALFVGGPGSDLLFEIPIEEDGRFGPVTESLRLEDAQGIQTIRVTPPAQVLGAPHQFLYAIAGDGSTRVVDRDLGPGGVGVECDTQIDPTLEAPTACHPITIGQNVNTIARRPFAVGPGIRAPLGATINDWAFHEISPAQAQENCGADSPTASAHPAPPHAALCSRPAGGGGDQPGHGGRLELRPVHRRDGLGRGRAGGDHAGADPTALAVALDRSVRRGSAAGVAAAGGRRGAR